MQYESFAPPTKSRTPVPEEAPGEFAKSLRAGAYGARSQLQSAAGLAGEALGFDQFAKNRNADAAELQAQAQQNAPRIGSYKQVLDAPDFSTGLRNAGDYVTGLIGSSLPIMGAGLAGGLVGGIGGGAAAAGRAMLGAATATMPFNVGDVAQKQLADPEAMKAPAGTRLRDAALGGGAASLIDGVVPGMVAGKILGQGAKQAATQTLRQTVGRNLAGVPLESAAEAGSETIKQYASNQDKAFDVEAIKEAAVGGAAAGTVFAGVGTAADVAHGNAAAVGSAARGAVSNIVDRTKPESETAQTEAPKKFRTVSEDIGDLIAKGRQYADESIDKVMSGEPFVDAQTFATEAGQKFSDNERVKAATKFADDIASDAGLTPERREQAAAFAADVGNQASQVGLAALKKTVDAGRFMAGKIDGLRQSFEASRNQAKRADVDVDATEVTTPRIGNGDITDVTPIKKSADYSGINKSIADQLGPLLESNPGLADRPDAVESLADSIRQAADDLPNLQLNSDTMRKLVDVLGDQTMSVLSQAHYLAEIKDPNAAETFFKKLNEVNELRQRTATLKNFVGNALTKEAAAQIRPVQYGELVNGLLKQAQGGYDKPNAGPYETAARNAEFRSVLEQHFGDKADAVSLAIEKEAKLSKGIEAEVQEGDFTEDGERITAEALDIKQFGYGKDNAPVMDSKVFRSTSQPGMDRAAQLLLDIKAKYPDHDVRFERMPGSDMGHVVAEKAKDTDKFSEDDLQGMRLNTKKYSNSPDRLEIKTPDGKLILDTRRIASVMDKRLPYSQDGQPRAQRLAEMFKEGVARLTEQYGAFDIPDTVVVGRAGDKDLTFGDIKKLDPRTEVDKERDSARQEYEKLEGDYYETTDPAERKTIKKRAAEIRTQFANDKDFELAQGDDVVSRGDDNVPRLKKLNRAMLGNKQKAVGTAFSDNGTDTDFIEQTTKDGQISLASRDNAPNDLINRSNMDGSPRFTSDRKSGINLKPIIGIANELKSGEFTSAGSIKIGNRLSTLIQNRGLMRESDVAKLQTITTVMSATEIGQIINPINEKYKTVIESGYFADDKALSKLKADYPIRNVSSATLAQRKLINRAVDELREAFDVELAATKIAIHDGKVGPGGSRVAGATHYDTYNIIGLRPDIFERGVPELNETGEQRTLRILAHELAHKKDYLAGYPSENAAGLQPGGKNYEEASAAMDKSPILDKWFGYIMSGGLNAQKTSRELFAQLHALYHSKKELMREYLPKSFAVIDAQNSQGMARDQRVSDAAGGAASGRQSSETSSGERLPRRELTSSAPTAPKASNLLEKAIDKRQEYLNNPPDNYSTEVARGHLDWATTQKERVDAEYEKAKASGDADRQDQLSDLRSSLKRLIAKGKSVLEGDASLTDFEGTSKPQLRTSETYVEALTKITPKSESAHDAIRSALQAVELRETMGIVSAKEEHEISLGLYKKLLRGTEEAAQQWMDTTFSNRANLANGMQKRAAEGTPDPKSPAAKKAALLEAASSSNPALLKELSTTSDAAALQRTVAELPPGAAADAANTRMAELVQDRDVAYGLTKKFSMDGTRIHEESGNEGFGATHDSPHRHEGKFDWRAHQGKGEGNASFGAGTYLSTAEGVHKSYKSQFTAAAPKSPELQEYEARESKLRGIERAISAGDRLNAGRIDRTPQVRAGFVRQQEELSAWFAKNQRPAAPDPTTSPTYEVSVNIKPEQLLDWNAPLSEQSELVQKALAKAGFKATDFRSEIASITSRLTELTSRLKDMTREEKEHFVEMEKWHDDNPIDSAMGERTDPRDERLYWVEERNKVNNLLKDANKEMTALKAKAATNFAFGDGGNLYTQLEQRLGSQAAASEYLQSLGILGHKYAASGGRNDVHPNYVVYDDSKITTNYVHFDKAKSGNSKTDTAATRQAIQDYITKVLGNSVKLKFADLSHAGEFERMHLHDIIRLSTTALDPMSTAHHEALHAFFAQLRDAKATDIMGVLQKAADSENVIRQLKEKYAGNDAVLAQLKDPEERVAYMYQHWSSGNLTIGFQPRTVMARVAEFIRGVLGIWSNDTRALAILDHFNSGEYAQSGRDVGATRQKYIQGGQNQALEAAKSFTAPLVRFADAVVSTGSGRVRDTGIPALLRIADIIKREGTDGRGGDQGFIAAARLESTKRNTALAESLKIYSQDELHEAMEGLQRGRGYNGANAARIRQAQVIIKAALADTRGYMLAAGVNIGYLGPDYFPRVWDSHYISKNQQAFKDMLEPYIRSGEYKGSADDLVRDLMARDGNEFGIDRKKLDFDEVKARPPGMQFKKTRTLDFIKPEDAAMFVTKDLLGTLTTYIHQAARKAEWTRRLGNGKLETLVEQAKKEGATPEQLKMTDTYLRGVDGTLGDSINPHARRITGNMIVYQNIRLLPFAVFSSIIDPMGVMVRGATAREAFATFKRGILEIPKGLGKQSADDRATEIAELVGVIDSAVLANTLGDVYTQGMVGGFAKKANALFFKFNLMEGLNRSFRIGASEAAIKFIGRHADGQDSKHSQRWINELGLEAGDIIPTADGRIALTTSEGLSLDQERRVHAAVNQWVDGAVLRPDAADKPIWMNDPHWALVSHLKQFVYSFQKTILERVVHEHKHGNYTPAMALASYVPMMMAADFVKGMIQGGGEQPEWKKGWDMVDYTSYAVQRSGLFGVGQFGLDAAKDVREGGVGVGALVGPTIEQFSDAVQLLGGHKQFGPMVLNALPANALYKNAFGDGSAPDAVISK